MLLGEVDYTDAGTYTCYVRGVREYTGLVECTYTVEEACRHAGQLTDNGDGTHTGTCTVCLEEVTGPHSYMSGACVACGFDMLAAADLNGDGRISAFDAQLLAEAKAGTRQLTDDQWAALGALLPQDILHYITHN